MNILRKMFQKFFRGSPKDDQQANKESKIEGTPDLTERERMDWDFEKSNEEIRRQIATAEEWAVQARKDQKRNEEVWEDITKTLLNDCKRRELESALASLITYRDCDIGTRETFIHVAKMRGEEANVADLDRKIERANREIDAIRKRLADLGSAGN